MSVNFYPKGNIPWIQGRKMDKKPPNWKGGERSDNEKFKDSYLFQNWRFSVFKRDNFTCRKCGVSKSGKLEAHHILNFSEYHDLRMDIDNGITFCKDCHEHFHKKYGFRKNTLEQIKEYLNILNYE